MPDLLIEIGTEEIPASYARPALQSIAAALRSACAVRRLALPEASLLGTPRRLVFHFADVPERAESVTEERRGPSAKAAFDAQGRPTKAAEGFARSAGVPLDGLRVVETEKGAYVTVTVRREGASAAEAVAEALPGALRAAGFPKTMRWTGSDLPFARPIRWIVALHGAEVLPLAVAGVNAGRESRGHRFLAPGSVSLPTADLDAYRRALEVHRVLVDPAARRARIVEGLAAALGPDRAATVNPALLDEVTWLSEWPSVIEGRIGTEFLELPIEVLETSMRVHLRFFPAIGADGRPEARFLSVMDRDPRSGQVVREGNEKVLVSRLSDARFFLAEDRKRTLEQRTRELAGKALHRELGSYLAKSERLAALAERIAGAMGLPPATRAQAVRAAGLCKADLVTLMVGEFPELQGTIGRRYALRDGEVPEVADAIEDHYRPRGPADALPRGPVATALALAEKIDNLCAFFKVGGAPTGSTDPFGLRRQALGLVRICVEKDVSFPLSETLDAAVALLGGEAALRDSVLSFVGDRLYHSAVDEGFRYDLVRATLAAGFSDLPVFRRRLAAVRELSALPWFGTVVTLAERTANILRNAAPAGTVDPALLAEPAEKALFAALSRAEPEVRNLVAGGKYGEAGSVYAGELSAPVQEFFAKVFVNVEDLRVRGNRLALLDRIRALFASTVADLSLVETGAA